MNNGEEIIPVKSYFLQLNALRWSVCWLLFTVPSFDLWFITSFQCWMSSSESDCFSGCSGWSSGRSTEYSLFEREGRCSTPSKMQGHWESKKRERTKKKETGKKGLVPTELFIDGSQFFHCCFVQCLEESPTASSPAISNHKYAELTLQQSLATLSSSMLPIKPTSINSNNWNKLLAIQKNKCRNWTNDWMLLLLMMWNSVKKRSKA